MKQAALLSFLSLIWCVAVLIKLSAVRSRGQPYVFTTWDGGLMLRVFQNADSAQHLPRRDHLPAH